MPKVKKTRQRRRAAAPYQRTAPVTSKVQVPVAQALQMRSAAPRYVPLPDGNILVKHREMIGYSAISSTGFSVDTDCPLFMSPSEPGTFPWLASIAKSYEKWRPRKVKLIYVPLCPTTRPGNIIMAFDYDPSDNLPVTAVEMEQNKTSISGPIWHEISLELSTRDMLENVKAYYTGPVSTPADRRLAYGGQFIIAYDGLDSTAMVGKFYLDYEIELLTPQQSPTGTFDLLTSVNGTSDLNLKLSEKYFAEKEAQRVFWKAAYYDSTNKTLNVPLQGDGGFHISFIQKSSEPDNLFSPTTWALLNSSGDYIPPERGAQITMAGKAYTGYDAAFTMLVRSPVEKAVLQITASAAAFIFNSLVGFVVSRCRDKIPTAP